MRSSLVCTEVCKSYADGESTVAAIDNVSLTAAPGELLAIAGPSGSGKTTLLHLIGGIETPDSGQVMLGELDLTSMSSSERTEFRAGHVSFVFAEMNLLPVITAYENVALGVSLLRVPEPEAHRRITDALELVGLADKAHRLPAKLSSGERQRVAIARAIARKAQIVIADEPTAHLDHELAREIGELLRDLARTHHSCVLLATHDPAMISASDSQITLIDGQIG